MVERSADRSQTKRVGQPVCDGMLKFSNGNSELRDLVGDGRGIRRTSSQITEVLSRRIDCTSVPFTV